MGACAELRRFQGDGVGWLEGAITQCPDPSADAQKWEVVGASEKEEKRAKTRRRRKNNSVVCVCRERTGEERRGEEKDGKGREKKKKKEKNKTEEQ